jgi:ADP-L-glycero-D-manno-heptose 6-epimerase
MNILITGGAGFIGSQLALEIQNKFPNWIITIFDKFNSLEKRINGNYKYFGDYKNILGLNVDIIVGDLANSDDLKLIFERKFDIIFHQGAISDTTELNQEEVLRINTLSFVKILDHCIKNNIKLVYASSAGTYGNTISPNKVGFGEKPENIYGFSKLQMDIVSRNRIINNNNAHVVGLRYFNVYGPGELYKRKTSSMILQLAKQALDFRKVRLFKFGEQRRDFVYINDVVEANLVALNSKSGIYNVGFGISRSFNDIISSLEIELGFKISIDYFDNPYNFYQNNTCADLETNKSYFPYSPKYSLEDGIKEYAKVIMNYSPEIWKNFYV